MLSAESDSFTSSFQFGYLNCLCLSDCCGRTSNSMLNKSGESGRPCLVSDFCRKSLSFFPLSIISAVGLS